MGANILISGLPCSLWLKRRLSFSYTLLFCVSPGSLEVYRRYSRGFSFAYTSVVTPHLWTARGILEGLQIYFRDNLGGIYTSCSLYKLLAARSFYIKSNMSQAMINRHLPDLSHYEEIYKTLHANPELSDMEEETANLIESHLRKLSSDLEIKTKIGGYGLIAICRNGDGKTILLRADFDALPVHEKTGLAYASAKKMKDVNGDLKPVMHGKIHILMLCSLPC